MIDKLNKRLADAEHRCGEAIAAIPAAILDGDKSQLTKLRKKRSDAAMEADDLTDAIDLAAKREQRTCEEAEAGRKRKAIKNVEGIVGERLEVAAQIDEALAVLEAAVTKHEELGRALAKQMAAAGSAETGRIARSASQNLRWATWRSAETAAELMCVPFANGGRRKTLAELDASSTPKFGEE